MKKLIFCFLVFASFANVLQAQPPMGSVSPEIALPDQSGNVVKLSSLRGKVVLIDFWASWCGPCRVSNRSMNSVYSKYKDKGFEVFAVSLDASKQPWNSAIKQDNTKWLQVIDVQAVRGNKLISTWGLNYIPSTFLLDKQGKIVAQNPEKEELVKMLETLL